VAHPSRSDRQRRTRPSWPTRPIQTQIQLLLTGMKTLLSNSFQHFKLDIIMRRADVLDVP